MHIKQQRKCVSCRNCKHQNEMLRIAKVQDSFLVDSNHKLGGRGAYVCKDNLCIEQTIKKRLLNKAFKMNIESSIYEELGKYEQNN